METGSDAGPSPSRFVAYIATEMLVELTQGEKDTSNKCLQRPSWHLNAGTLIESHTDVPPDSVSV
jgi:hypothetical protein